MPESYQPIACDLHDHLEIACSRGYRLRIELVDGSSLEAQAITTETTPSKEEFLVVSADTGLRRLRLDMLLAITPLEAGAGLGRVSLR